MDGYIVATAGGLLCYKRQVQGILDLLVYNPMTGSSQRLFLQHPISKWLDFTSFCVDLESNTYRVVFMGAKATLIFDSGTRTWKTFQSWSNAFPDLADLDDGDHKFVRKNMIYKQIGYSSKYVVFDMHSGRWSAIEDVDLPCDVLEPYHLGCWQDEVVLVQLHVMNEDPVRIWMLQDDGMDILSLSASCWKKVPVKVPDAMEDLVYEFADCWSHGHEYVCFTTGWTDHWLKYTFKTKSWQVMPCHAGFNPEFDPELEEYFDWFNFEPQLHMDPRLSNSKDSDLKLCEVVDEQHLLDESEDSDHTDEEGEGLDHDSELDDDFLGDQTVDPNDPGFCGLEEEDFPDDFRFRYFRY